MTTEATMPSEPSCAKCKLPMKEMFVHKFGCEATHSPTTLCPCGGSVEMICPECGAIPAPSSGVRAAWTPLCECGKPNWHTIHSVATMPGYHAYLASGVREGGLRVQIYTDAIRCARIRGQVIGEKHEYYVTIAQLEQILQSAGWDAATRAKGGTGDED